MVTSWKCEKGYMVYAMLLGFGGDGYVKSLLSWVLLKCVWCSAFSCTGHVIKMENDNNSWGLSLFMLATSSFVVLLCLKKFLSDSRRNSRLANGMFENSTIWEDMWNKTTTLPLNFLNHTTQRRCHEFLFQRNNLNRMINPWPKSHVLISEKRQGLHVGWPKVHVLISALKLVSCSKALQKPPTKRSNRQTRWWNDAHSSHTQLWYLQLTWPKQWLWLLVMRHLERCHGQGHKEACFCLSRRKTFVTVRSQLLACFGCLIAWNGLLVLRWQLNPWRFVKPLNMVSSCERASGNWLIPPLTIENGKCTLAELSWLLALIVEAYMTICLLKRDWPETASWHST